MSDDIKALREALDAGPWGGRWLTHPTATHAAVRAEGSTDSPPRRICTVGSTNGHPTDKRTARFIAAANPATIRSLLAELDEARRDAERLRFAMGAQRFALCELDDDMGDWLPVFDFEEIDAAMKEQQP